MAPPIARPRCKLLSIAPEVRNQIYSEVFSQPPEDDLKPTTLPALLFTCRKINTEATKLFYSSTTHTFVAPGNRKRVKSPVHYELIPKIRYITVELRDKLMASTDNAKSSNCTRSTISPDGTRTTNCTNCIKKAKLIDFLRNADSARSSLQSKFRASQIEVPWQEKGGWSWQAMEGDIEWVLVSKEKGPLDVDRAVQIMRRTVA